MVNKKTNLMKNAILLLDEDNMSPVVIVDEPVSEDAVDLVQPQQHELGQLPQARRGEQERAPHYTREVAQVEHVVALAGRRQELARHGAVHLQRRRHHRLGACT